MSSHATLALHLSEETVTVQVDGILKPFPGNPMTNPIGDYFSVADGLAAKLTKAPYDTDAEVLGLLLLGVVSAAEFYFRSVLGTSLDVCPLCRQHAELLAVPLGAFEFFSESGYSHALGAFEHESLADSKKIRGECKRFTGFELSKDASADKAITDFELLCELRHCFVHARGLAGLKACRALNSEYRSLQRLLVGKAEAFELLKLSHNAVRAFNRFLANSILNRWVDEDLFKGRWKEDKAAFTKVIEAFWIKGEDSYGAIAWKAYKPFQRAVQARRASMAAKVPPGS